MFKKILSFFSFSSNNNNFNALESQKRYKNLLFNISHGIHNYKDETFFRNSVVNSDDYEKNIREFFSYLRWIILDTDICSEKKYQKILYFVTKDFNDYFNGNSNQLDLIKFKNICEGN